LLSSSSCGPTGPGGLAPVSVPDSEAGCIGGQRAWKLEVLDRRAERRETERVTALVADSIRKSFGTCEWNTGRDAGTVTIEIDTFSSIFSGREAMWDAEAVWTVNARDASGKTLTEFECQASGSRPNYQNANNEKELLNQVFDQALRRALAGL